MESYLSQTTSKFVGFADLGFGFRRRNGLRFFKRLPLGRLQFLYLPLCGFWGDLGQDWK